MEVNIHEAKTHLSRLLERVASGEENRYRQGGQARGKVGGDSFGASAIQAGFSQGRICGSRRFNDSLA